MTHNGLLRGNLTGSEHAAVHVGVNGESDDFDKGPAAQENSIELNGLRVIEDIRLPRFRIS